MTSFTSSHVDTMTNTMSQPASSASVLDDLRAVLRERLGLGARAVPDRDVAAALGEALGHRVAHAAGADPADLVPFSHSLLQLQYGLAIGSSSAGYSEMIFAPCGVRITSSSMRAAETPSLAGQ